MKITRRQLRRLIAEELRLGESFPGAPSRAGGIMSVSLLPLGLDETVRVFAADFQHVHNIIENAALSYFDTSWVLAQLFNLDEDTVTGIRIGWTKRAPQSALLAVLKITSPSFYNTLMSFVTMGFHDSLLNEEKKFLNRVEVKMGGPKELAVKVLEMVGGELNDVVLSATTPFGDISIDLTSRGAAEARSQLRPAAAKSVLDVLKAAYAAWDVTDSPAIIR